MKWILNGTEVTTRNVLKTALVNDWTGRPSELEVGADNLIFVREALPIIHDWITTYGPFQGIPLQCVTNDGQTLEYYVDLYDNKPKFSDFEIECTIKKRGGKDNFFDNADGTSFELMSSKGVNFTKIDIPYLIIRDNQLEVGISLAGTIYIMTRELLFQIIAIQEAITNIIDAVTPNTGTAVTFNIGQISTLSIKALLQIAVAALILIALIKLAQQFFELIFPKIRYFQACKVKHLIEKGCEFLGYTLESNLLDSLANWTLLPVPLVKAKESIWDKLENDLNFAYTKGYPTSSDAVSTVGQLIREVENMFNARTRVTNGVVQIEIRNYWQNVTTNTVLPSLNNQEKRTESYFLNTEDAWKRTLIQYQTDMMDVHTLDFFDPTDAEYSTEPTLIANADLVTIKGLNNVQIPFSLGVRKNNLNWIEELAKEFFMSIDGLINAFGGNGNLTAQIQNRIGVLQISSQFFTRTKLLYTVAGKQPSNYVDIVRASSIYSTYHTINEIQINDYKIFEDATVRMSSEDFVNLINNNYAIIDGLSCELLTMQFFEEESHAIISYKQPFDYANGKVYVLTIND